MPEQKFIHIRYPDGREQRLIAGPKGERVAEREVARGAKRFEPEAAYTAEDAERAAREAEKERTTKRATRAAKRATGPEKASEGKAE